MSRTLSTVIFLAICLAIIIGIIITAIFTPESEIGPLEYKNINSWAKAVPGLREQLDEYIKDDKIDRAEYRKLKDAYISWKVLEQKKEIRKKLISNER